MLLKSKTDFFALIALTLTAGVHPARADALYTVTVDTSSVSGSAGFIDLQFNGSNGSANAMATIDDFESDAILGASSGVSNGNVAGQLPDPVTLSIDGTYQANELNQGITFGNFIVFEVDLSGNPPPAGNSFALSFYDSRDVNGILPGNFFGEVAEIDVNASNTALQLFGPTTTIVPNQTTTPEPGSLLLLSAGAAGWALWWPARRRAGRP